MGQMMFTKYIVVVDDDVDVHNTSEVLFRLCANTDPQRDSLFTKGPGGRARSRHLRKWREGMEVGSKLGSSTPPDTQELPAKASSVPGRR
jgi:UbiD family decarboxylase